MDIIKIVIENVGFTTLTPTYKITKYSNLLDLGCDDLDRCEITIALETLFNIEIPDREWTEHWLTVQDIINTVNECLKWS
jgi:acyl carrier protein